MKKWGRNKIKQELARRHVSAYCIKKGMKEIDESEYESTISLMVEKKLATVSGHEAIRRKKVFEFCYRKGYEANYINSALAVHL